MSRRGAWPVAVAAGAAGLLALGAAAAAASSTVSSSTVSSSTVSSSTVSSSTVSSSTVSSSTVSSSTVSSSTVSSSTGQKWRVTASVKTNETGDFTAVVATGKTTGWAFDGTGSGTAPIAYQLSGGTWTRASFPGKKDEEVVTAAATSPSNVWAFTQGFGAASRVLHYNGHTWSVVKTFTDEIANASVVAANDVWVFGMTANPDEPALGAWHYNGSTWTRVSKTIEGGSALSASNVWGFTGVDVEHWNGAKWTATSVKSLLPAKSKQGLNDPQVVGILALSAKNVYAIGNGDAEDEGGPVVVLHYNGSKWTRVAQGSFGFGPGAGDGAQISSDGSGGLWLPMTGASGGAAHLVHYATGKLTAAALPVAAAKITVSGVSLIPGTTRVLAGGYTHASGNLGADVVAVLLTDS
jgi:hypothetical protein